MLVGLVQPRVLSLLSAMVSLWSDVTQQPILAIESGTCPNVIADSTRRIQQCVQELLTHLDNRTRALATSGNSEAALEDVARIQQLVPFSAVGYLCAGHVYSLQGRQKAAIDVYDQGLDAVPLLDPSYQQLVEARSMAQERDSIRIDFIKDFHIDIIENIAPWILSQGEMKTREIRQYLGVSPVWRERLLMCIRDLHLESLSDYDFADDHELLEQVASRCTALTLQRNTPGFPRLMSRTHPRDDDYDDYDEDDEDYISPIDKEIAALVSVGSTLTQLKIMTCGDGIWFGEILSSCPNLVHLETYDVHTDMEDAPECHPNLKRLLFWLSEDESDIHDITKRLPELEVFSANPIYDSNDLKILQDNCPNLKVIGCNDYDASCFHVPTTSTSITTRGHQHYIGVHTVYIDRHESNHFQVDIRDIVNFMKRNSHTLQHVYFYVPVGGSADDVAIFNHAGDGALFNSVTSLINCMNDHDDMLLPRWIARESPHLKEIKISKSESSHLHGIDTGALFDDLIGHCELESVTFQLHGDPTMDTGGVERFIQYHGTFDSLLHTLILPKHTHLSKDALEALTKLPRLENLSISWPLTKEEDQEDENSSHLIGKLDRLQHLEIFSDDVVPDDVFLQLSKLNITSLNLYIPILKLPTILLSLLQCPNLQELFVSHSLGKDETFIDEIRNMLKSKIEKVNFDEYKLWT
ncbi:predicted protein [Lichtheimia corymbifera JMRC:FSU:9682]|uniref:Uncharacterized protein n=1 Tax=Lichtheimia corymbifera JMRC:FSU:9682 TaxID=1263082 RepID=A0A068S0G2_9FUNG|nr:predicted protein [Lichtheimia corymbifera JMRC:FSU:9682]